MGKTESFHMPMGKSKNKLIKIGLLLGLLTVPLISSFLVPMPEGTSYEGDFHRLTDIEFIYDLSYRKDGKVVREHRIFEELLKLIKESEEFIIIDMFLFNDD